MGIKDALDTAKTDASFDKRMQSKAEMEYATLKTSIKFIRTKEKKKFEEFENLAARITRETFTDIPDHFENLYKVLQQYGDDSAWSNFSLLLRCHKLKNNAGRGANDKNKASLPKENHKSPKATGVKQHRQNNQTFSPHAGVQIPVKEINEKQLVNLTKEIDNLMSETSNQKKQLEEKDKKIEELTTRLSRVASQQLTQGNPNITDLSDGNRPTKLGERFSQVYDDQWSEAFEALKAKGKEEKEIVTELLNKVQDIYNFMQKSVEELMQNLAYKISEGIMYPFQPLKQASYQEIPLNGTEGLIRDLVKTQGHHALKSVQEKLKVTIHVRGEDKRINKYIQILSELIWYMVIQDPPMVLKFIRKGETMDKEGPFKPYSKTGSVAEVCVWPALFLHEGGPMISRGFALPQ